MITGTFRQAGRPYVSGRLVIPRFGIATAVNFLVDTGADFTIIHPPDVRHARMPAVLPETTMEVAGVGGSAEFFSASATIVFTDSDLTTAYPYRISVTIAKQDASNKDFPSLLGRDILDCWYLESDPTNGVLRFTVRRTL